MDSLAEALEHVPKPWPFQLVEEVGPWVWSATTNKYWAWIAHFLSHYWGGWLIHRHNGVSWLCGRRRGYLISPETVEPLRQARATAELLGIEPGWSFGSIANGLLKTLNVKDWPAKGIAERFPDRVFGHQHATPCRLEYGCLFDIKACYYNLLWRLPGLFPFLCYDKLCWAWTDDEVMERWHTILGAVKPIKPLRNAIWGTMLGSSEGRWAFHRGQRKRYWTKSGPFRPAGLLIGRTAWELCRTAAEQTESIHSYTDSILCHTEAEPTVWADCGLDYELRNQGPSHVLGPGRYRIGDKATCLYDEKSRFLDPVPIAPKPDLHLFKQWLV